MRWWNVADDKSQATSTVAGVNCLTRSPTGDRLIVGCDDGTVKSIELRDGLILDTLVRHAAPVDAVAVSGDAELAYASGADVFVFKPGGRYLTLPVRKDDRLSGLSVVIVPLPNGRVVLLEPSERFVIVPEPNCRVVPVIVLPLLSRSVVRVPLPNGRV